MSTRDFLRYVSLRPLRLCATSAFFLSPFKTLNQDCSNNRVTELSGIVRNLAKEKRRERRGAEAQRGGRVEKPMLLRRNQSRFICHVLVLLILLAMLLSSDTSQALAKRSVRVMTYNIHVGVGMDKKLDLQRIADVINEEQPDLVGLQEVDRGVERTQRKDEIQELAALTHMEYAFAPNLDYQGGQYGVAILSRFKIRNTEHRMYQNRREAERRGMIRIEVQVDGKLVNFVTTHLDYQFQDGRLFEAEQLLEFLRDVRGALIVTGDFNEEPTGTSYQLMLKLFDDAWASSHQNSNGFSYPADKPVKRIDYVFLRRADRLKAKKSRVVETLASDHIPILTEVELR